MVGTSVSLPLPFWSATTGRFAQQRVSELQILGCHSSEKQKPWFTIQQQTLKGTVPLNDCEWEYCKEAAINQASEETTARLARHAKHYATQNRKRKKIDTPIKPPAEKYIKYRLYPKSEQWQLIRQAFGVCGWLYNRTRDHVFNNPATVAVM